MFFPSIWHKVVHFLKELELKKWRRNLICCVGHRCIQGWTKQHLCSGGDRALLCSLLKSTSCQTLLPTCSPRFPVLPTCVCVCVCVLSLQSHPTLCDLMDYSPPGLSVQWDSPSKNTGVGCHALLQGIFQTQESNPRISHLLHWKVGSLALVPPGKPSSNSQHTLTVYLLLSYSLASVGTSWCINWYQDFADQWLHVRWLWCSGGYMGWWVRQEKACIPAWWVRQEKVCIPASSHPVTFSKLCVSVHLSLFIHYHGNHHFPVSVY